MARKFLKYTLILVGMVLCTCVAANALVFRGPYKSTPEIDSGMAVSAFTLLAGSIAVLRVRRKK
jgi:hypothetical protein